MPRISRPVVHLMVVLTAIGFLAACNELPFGSGNLSEDEKALKRLETEVADTQKSIRSAERSAGTTGMDTTSEIEAGIKVLERIEKDLKALKRSAESEEVKKGVDELLKKVVAAKTG